MNQSSRIDKHTRGLRPLHPQSFLQELNRSLRLCRISLSMISCDFQTGLVNIIKRILHVQIAA